MDMTAQPETAIQRGPKQDVPESRAKEVARLCEDVKADRKYWEYAFKRMKDWRAFARGRQWPGQTRDQMSDADRAYVVNITQRHIHQRTAHIYAKNPRFRFRKSKRLNMVLWDGTAQQLAIAQQIAMNDPKNNMAVAILTEAAESAARGKMLARVGETMSILYEYQVREQNPPTKKMMKKQVKTALTCGVAYIKQTFQRAMDLSPDQSQSIQDMSTKLAEIERLAADLQDGEIGEHDAEMEQLRAQIAAMEASPEVVVREGLALDYPDSVNIIPDQNLTYLPGFVGCHRVTEQYCLTPEQVKRISFVSASATWATLSLLIACEIQSV
jgi:hypothetical protein